MDTDWDVIVVGAGLAGLAAAATAERSGSRVLVLEAHHPGGRARTVERQGFVLNRGAHALYAGGAGMEVLRSLGINPVGAPPPLARYRALASGRQHLLPTGPSTLARTRLLGPRSKAQLVWILGRLPRIDPDPLGRTPVADWLAGFRLRPDAAAVIRALIRLGTYTDHLEELSADAAVAQLQRAARGGVLYLDGGWAQLIESLSGGLQVRTGVRVTGVDRVGNHLDVHTGEGTLSASGVVLATGGPDAIAALLPDDPGWGDLGAPVTAACLDLGVARVPSPGYVLSIDDPIYVTVQSPPARQAPDGQSVVAAIRYGARQASEDRDQLERLVTAAGVRAGDVVTQRFLASMTVSGTLPRAGLGGLAGRPPITATGVPGVVMAGDWVGPDGLLADAALASGQAAGRQVERHRSDAAGMVR